MEQVAALRRATCDARDGDGAVCAGGSVGPQHSHGARGVGLHKRAQGIAPAEVVGAYRVARVAAVDAVGHHDIVVEQTEAVRGAVCYLYTHHLGQAVAYTDIVGDGAVVLVVWDAVTHIVAHGTR